MTCIGNLQAAGDDGFELTKAGYLKPTVVRETMAALNWESRWYGSITSEYNTQPVLNLRGLTQRWKFLRKYKDRLVRTPSGQKMYDDATALWGHLAECLAHRDTDAEERKRQGFRMPDGGPVQLVDGR